MKVFGKKVNCVPPRPSTFIPDQHTNVVPFPSPSNTCIESWKQIADYLHCSERQAQRYKKKGMPVYHIADFNQSRVYAYSDELDHWLHKQHNHAGCRNDNSLPDGVTDLSTASISTVTVSEKERATVEPCLKIISEQESSPTRVMGGSRMILGRDAGASMVFADLRVSRRHALIERFGNDFLLKDLGSRNGTSVNGNRIHQPTTLHPGDRIGLGGAVFVRVQIVSVTETVDAELIE